MNKVTSYLKNVGKSISYATVDVVTKKMIPEVGEFTDTNKELFKAVYSTVSHSKKSINYGKKLARESQIYKDINKGIDNVFSDIKSGNFYNKEREQAAIDAAGDAMAGGLGDFDDFGDLDDFGSDDFGDFSDFDDFDNDDSSSSVDKGDIVIADTVSKSSNLSAQLISKTVANSSNGIIKTNIATTNMAMAQNVELVAGIRTSIAGVHESINGIFKLAQENIPTAINNQSQYFTDSMGIMKENNAILKEMLEMQRNIYKREEEKAKVNDQFSEVFYGGSVDLAEYFKAISKNAVNTLDKTGTIGSFLKGNNGEESMLSHMLSNPIGFVMTGLVESYIPKTLAKQIASFSKTLGNIFPAMIAKLNGWKNNKSGIFEMIGSIFGLNTDKKNSIDTGKYNKGAVPFDGITRKAIVDVIPEHLSKIESLLGGSSQRVYDYESGKWMSNQEIRKKVATDYESAVKGSFDEILPDIKSFIKGVEDTKALDAKARKALDEDIYKMMKKTFEDGGFFSPENLKKNSVDYGFNNAELMEALGDALSNVPLSKLSSVSANAFDNRRSYSQKMRDAENNGYSIFRKLFDNSKNDSHLEFHKEYKDQVIGNKGANTIINSRDKNGKNVLDYLKDILINVSFMRQNGSGGGIGTGSNGPDGGSPKNFDEFAKEFDINYVPENIMKATDEENKKNERYNKSHHDPNADMVEAISQGIFNVKKSSPFSNLDEFKSFGKRYKETNKWQKEMAKIPGDTFLQKFQSTQNMQEKYALILGSLSDIAKKPASVLTGMIATAERSIYNFLFQADTDETDEEGNKIKGFFHATLDHMKAAWVNLTATIDEKLISPLVDKFGLNEKWNNLKDKINNTKPMEMLRNFGQKIKGALGEDISNAYAYTKNSVSSIVDPYVYGSGMADFQKGRISSIKDKNSALKDEKIKNIIETIEQAKSKEEVDYIKSKLDKKTLTILSSLGYAEGGTFTAEETAVHEIPLSKGETVTVETNGTDEEENRKKELDAIIERLLGYTNSMWVSAKNMRKKTKNINNKLEENKDKGSFGNAVITETINTAKSIPSAIGKVFGIKGDTEKEQDESIEKEQSELRKTVGEAVGDMGGLGATTVSKAIIGGGLGLLSGVVGGPLIGASLGAATNIIKNNKTINELIFGEDIEYDENGFVKDKKGGIVSKNVMNVFKKYIPDMGKFGVTGAVASLLLPFGPLAGAAIGAGVGLAKNSQTMNNLLFGDEDGLFNKDRKEKIKQFLPKAAIGAAAGMFLGPFGMLGNAAVGAGAGLLTGTEEFRDIIFGEKDENGNRIGGIKDALKEHFIQPLKDFGTNFKDDFFGFIKTSMIDPLNEAITPITSEIAFMAKKLFIGIPKKIAGFFKDELANPFLRILQDNIVDPVADAIKGLFSKAFGVFKGVISAPFRAVGAIGNKVRGHQVKVGRDAVGFAKDRVQFAKDKGFYDSNRYKYKQFDETLATKAEEEDKGWLQELTARTGVLAHGADHFDKEVKDAGKELMKVVTSYSKLKWFSHDKKIEKKIKDYIRNNDIESAIVELTNIKEMRTTGGPLDGDASDAIAKFSSANKKYQDARDARNKFNEIKDTDNEAWMEQNFGPDWKKLDQKKLFEYSRKELNHVTGQKISKNNLFKGDNLKNLVTEGDTQIKESIDKIFDLLNKDGTVKDIENQEYEEKVKAGTEKANNIINARKSDISSKLSNFKFNDKDNIVDLLYSNPQVLDLVLIASKQGINYDDATVEKLCGMKLGKEEIQLLMKYPYVATLDEKTIKKNLNHIRNDHGTIFDNRFFGAKKIRNNNLKSLDFNAFVGQINSGVNEDPSQLKTAKEVGREDLNDDSDDNKFTYVSTNYGLRRFVKDDKGEWTADLSDSETKETLEKEKEAKAGRNSLLSGITGIKDNITNGFSNLFNRDKEKEIKEKKEPWYKKLFDFDIFDGVGTKVKFGAAIAGTFTAIGAIYRLWENREPGGVIDTIGKAVGKAVNPVIEKLKNWFTNEGEYAAPDKGLTGFLDNVVFPSFFTGVNVFFGKIAPAIVTSFVKNIPTLIKAALKGAKSLFFGEPEKQAKSVNANDIRVDGKPLSGSQQSSTPWLNNLATAAATTANSITSIDYNNSSNSTDNNIPTITNDNSSGSDYTSPTDSSGGNNSTPTDSSGGNNNSQPNNNSNINSVIQNIATQTLNGSAPVETGTVNNTNGEFTIDGIGPVYTKNKNGELVRVSSQEELEQLNEFWNESGTGHWVRDESGNFTIAEDSAEMDEYGKPLIARIAGVAGRSFLTGKMPGVFRNGKYLVKGTDFVLRNIPLVGGFYKKTARPIAKAIGKTMNGVSRTSLYARKKFDQNIKKEDKKRKRNGAYNNPDFDASLGKSESSYNKYKDKENKKNKDKENKKNNKTANDTIKNNKPKNNIKKGPTGARVRTSKGNVAAKTAAKSKKYNSGLLSRVTKFITDGIDSILNSSTVAKQIKKALKESGSKKSVKKVTKNIINKLTSGITEKMKNISVKTLAKISAKINPIITVGYIIKDFTIGLDKAEAILGISEPTAVQTLIAGLVNIIAEDLFFGFIDTSKLVDFAVEYIFPIFNIETAKYEKQKESADAEAQAYADKEGLKSYNTRQYLDETKSVSGKTWKSIKSWFKGDNNNTTKPMRSKGDKYKLQRDIKAGKGSGKNKSVNVLYSGKGKNDNSDKNKQPYNWTDSLLGLMPGINPAESAKSWLNFRTDIDQTWDTLKDKFDKEKKNIYKNFENSLKRLDYQLGALLGLEDETGSPISMTNSMRKPFRKIGLSLNSGWSSVKNTASSVYNNIMNNFNNSNSSSAEAEIDTEHKYTGTNKNKYKNFNGKGSQPEEGFVSQVDPKYKNRKFNVSGDTEHQTLGDSGCAPATAANVINFYAGRGSVMNNATNAALRFKDKNSGVTPDYFESYLGKQGISTQSTADKREILGGISSGNPTILLGTDPSNKANTPYGSSSSHYVLATGLDGKGNVIIQDPESREPDRLYPINDVLNQSQIGMITSKTSGKGKGNNSVKSIISKLKNKINIAGRGKSKEEIEKIVWTGLRGAGFSEVSVAGAMGNIKHESGFDPSIVERGGGGGFGLIQWTGGRRDKIEAYARKKGKNPNDVNIQVEYLIKEMTPGSGVYSFANSSSRYDGKVWKADSFKNAKTVEDATKAFCFCFERPSYDPSINHIDKRISSAKEYYKKFTGTAAADGSMSSDNTSSNNGGLFNKFAKAALSYYDEKLLGLFGLNQQEDSMSADGSIGGFNGPVNGSAQDVIKIAAGEIGYKEGSNNSNKYGKEYGMDNQPWCAIFVWWCCKHAGCPQAFYGGQKSAYVPTVISYYRNKGREVNKKNGQPGDFFSINGMSHIGIIEKNLGNGRYQTIEGNCSDMVKRMDRGSEITYIVRPEYEGASGQGLVGKNKDNVPTLSGRGSFKNKIAASKMNHLSGRSTDVVAPESLLRGSERKKMLESLKYNEMMTNLHDGNIPVSKVKEYSNILGTSGNTFTSNGTINTSTGIMSGRGTSKLTHYNAYRKSISGKGSGFNLPKLNTPRTGNNGFILPNLNTGSYSTSSYNNSAMVASSGSAVERLLSVIIDVLSIIANNSEKLSEIVALLSKALDLNLTNNDISKLSSNKAQIKNKIANAMKTQGSVNGMGNSIMNSSTESLASAMYAIATA